MDICFTRLKTLQRYKPACKVAIAVSYILLVFLFVDHKVAIENTILPSHLEKMLVTLFEEEKLHDGMSGPCMEYLLQHKILETLYTLARTDVSFYV